MIDFNETAPAASSTLPYSAPVTWPAPRSTRPLFQLLSEDDLAALPDPEWLIPGVLVAGAFTMLYGAPGSSKSFLTLGMAMAVATGQPWMGKATRPGAVVYVAAEGASGYKARRRAWRTAHPDAPAPSPIHYVTEAVQLHRAYEVDTFLASLDARGVRPALVIFDTLSRCFAGGDENSAAAASEVVRSVTRIGQQTGAAVVLVHHSRKDDAVERGSGSLRGAVDTMLRVRKTGDAITLSCEKMKDAAEFQQMSFRLREAGGSCVLEPTGAAAPTAPALTDNERRCLDVLPAHEWTRHGVWKGLAVAAGVPKGSFGKVRTDLMDAGLVKRDEEGRYRRAAAGADGISGINA